MQARVGMAAADKNVPRVKVLTIPVGFAQRNRGIKHSGTLISHPLALGMDSLAGTTAYMGG